MGHERLRAGRERTLLASHDEARRAVVVHAFRLPGQAPAGVDHDAGRVPPGDAPDGEERIVRDDGTDSDHHRVDARPDLMQMIEGGRPVDMFGVTGQCCDTTIQ